MDTKRVFVAAATAAIPSALSLFIYVGPLWLVAGYLRGCCLWGTLIAPLSIVLKRVDFFLVTTVCTVLRKGGLGALPLQSSRSVSHIASPVSCERCQSTVVAIPALGGSESPAVAHLRPPLLGLSSRLALA
jgi:hypothetical protein